MKKKRKTGKIILVILLLLAAGAVGAMLLPGPKVPKEAASMLTNTRNQEAYRGPIRLTTEGNGLIEAADERAVTADYSVKVKTIEVEKGDLVAADDVIAVLDPESIKDQILVMENQLSEVNNRISSVDRSGSSTLTSPIAGRVKRIFAKEDEYLTDVVAEHGGVMEIAADGRLKVEIPAVTGLKAGEEVLVTFLNYEEEGIVSEVQNGICTVVIEDAANYLVDTEAVVTDEEEQVLGTGYLKSSHPYMVEGAYGIVDEIRVDTGDYVEKGTTLLTRRNYTYNGDYLAMLEEREEITTKLQKLRMLERDPVLYAESDGIISEILLMDETMMQEDAVIYRLISTDTFWLKAEIDELDIAGVQTGQTAMIVFDAFDTEEYEGQVEKISALGTNIGGVTKYTVTISVPGIEKVKTSMSATATIVTDEKEDALLVPVDAIQTADGKRCVTVVRGETQEIVPVTLGLVNNTEAEILEGISEGDVVVVTEKSEFQLMVDMMQQGVQQGQ